VGKPAQDQFADNWKFCSSDLSTIFDRHPQLREIRGLSDPQPAHSGDRHMSEVVGHRLKTTKSVVGIAVLLTILLSLFGAGTAQATPCNTTSLAKPWKYKGNCYETKAEAEEVLRGIKDASGNETDDQDWRIYFEPKITVGNRHIYELKDRDHLPSPAWQTRTKTAWVGGGLQGTYSAHYATASQALAWLTEQQSETLTYRGNRFVTQGSSNLEHKHYSDAYPHAQPSLIDFDAFDFRSCSDYTAGVEDAKINAVTHSIYRKHSTPPPTGLWGGVNNCDVNGVWYAINLMPVFDVYQVEVPVCQAPYESNGTKCVSDDLEEIHYGPMYAGDAPPQPRICPDPSNPCNPSDGNKSQTEVDFVMDGQGGLTFARYYNSKGPNKSARAFATGWRHTYSRRLDEVPDEDATISFAVQPGTQTNFYYTADDACTLGWDDIKATVWDGDLANGTSTFKGGNTCKIEENGNVLAYFPIRNAGGLIAFSQPADIKTVSRPDGSVITFEHDGTEWVNYLNPVLELEEVGSDFVFTDANDTKETYDSAGNLVSIETRNGRVTTLEYGTHNYTANKPVKVIGPFGHVINLGYNFPSGELIQVSSPGGGLVRYEYSGGRLVRTTHDTVNGAREYVYDDPNLPDHLTGIIDRNGDRFATWAYDDSGRAILSEHAGGKERVELAYNANGSTTLTLGNGAVQTYNFETVDGQRKLASITGDLCGTCPGGNIGSKTYDTNGFLDEAEDRNGNVTQTVRNSRGLVESRIEAKGTPEERTTTTIWHPTFRLPTQVVSPKNTTNMAYDANGNMTSLTVTDGVDSRTWAFAYNASGQPLTIDGSRTDVSDVTTLTYYNCTTGQYCGQVATTTNALGQTTSYEYGGDGILIRTTDPNGLETTFSRNSIGQLTRIEQEPTSGQERETKYTYDDLKRISSIETPDGMVLTYSYDAAHYLRSVTDNLGNRIDYDYDAMGNLKDEDTYDPGNNLERALDYVYDINQRIDTVSAGGFVTDFTTDLVGNLTVEVDPALADTQHSYDALNRLEQSIDALSGVINYTYDDHDNLTSVTAANGAATTYVYDDLDNLVQEVSPDRGTTTYTYDDAGNQLSKLDARNKLTTYAYDALNRLTLLTLDGGGTIAYEYDVGPHAKGRLNKITDASGQTTWSYNNFGDVTAKTQTIGAVALTTSYGYDYEGRLTSVTLPSGKIVTYGYNSYQQDSVAVDGTTILSGATYDPFGPVNGWTWGSGNLHSRDYDLRGLPSSQTIADGNRTLAYDNAGRLIDIVDNRFDQDVGYDQLGRLTSFAATDVSVPLTGYRWLALAAVGDPDTTYVDSITISGSGDFVWSPTMPTTAGDYEIRLYEPGGFSRVGTSEPITVSAAQPLPPHLSISETDVAAGGTQTATLTNPTGGPWDWYGLYRMPTSSYLQWAYVGNGPIFEWQFTVPTTLGEYQVRLNRSGPQLKSPVFTVSATGSSAVPPVAVDTTLVATGGTVTVTVAEAVTSPTALPPPVLPLQVFTYDANGNRASIDEDATQYAYTNQSSSNRLLSTAGPTAKTYTFDAAGNATGDGIHTYAYDDRGRLVSMDLGAATYEHNGQGQRVKKDNGSVSLFVYDEAGHLVGEYDASGTAVQEHVWFNGAPVAVLQDNNTHYVHTDHLGTPRAITDGGTVIWRWESDAFGATAAQEDPDGDTYQFTYNLRFPGQYYDVETALHYNYFRTYDPATGRYIQSDPIGLGGGANSFGYVDGSPTATIDPFGLCGWACVIEPGIILAARPTPFVTPRPSSPLANGVRQALKQSRQQAEKVRQQAEQAERNNPSSKYNERRIDRALEEAGVPPRLRPDQLIESVESCPMPAPRIKTKPDYLELGDSFLQIIKDIADSGVLNHSQVPVVPSQDLFRRQLAPSGHSGDSGNSMAECALNPLCV